MNYKYFKNKLKKMDKTIEMKRKQYEELRDFLYTNAETESIYAHAQRVNKMKILLDEITSMFPLRNNLEGFIGQFKNFKECLKKSGI